MKENKPGLNTRLRILTLKPLTNIEKKAKWIDYINNPYQTYVIGNGTSITIKILPEYDL